MTISRHTIAATVIDATGASLPLAVQDSTIKMDENWSPYVQGTLVCTTPDAATLQRIDPRTGARVRVELTQSFGESDLVSAVSADWAGWTAAQVTAAYAGQQAAAISATYGRPYNAFGTRTPTSKTLDLALRTRVVDENTGTMTLEAASDESLLQDAALLEFAPISPNTTSIAAAIDTALSRIGAHLTEALDVLVDDAATLVWYPGVSGWDYANQLAQGAERRLWCDEARVWRLSDPLQPASGGLNITATATATSDSIDRDADWYDGVVVEFVWTDALDATRVAYDIAGPPTAQRVLHIVWRRPYFRAGAATTMLKRYAGRGRDVTVTAISDYDATPGDSFNITLVDGTYQTGMVSSVAWAYPADEMTINTRDLQTAPPYSWVAQPPEVAWQDVPAGIDWTEMEAAA